VKNIQAAKVKKKNHFSKNPVDRIAAKRFPSRGAQTTTTTKQGRCLIIISPLLPMEFRVKHIYILYIMPNVQVD
jgi:hypothetical protein